MTDRARSVTILEGDLSKEVAQELRVAGRIAVDTETSGLDWPTDQLQLCQLYAPTTGVVLLRSVVDRPAHLADLLADPAVVKVFHFAPFDIRFLQAKWGAPVNSVECTKAASKILSPTLPPAEHSLKQLLRRVLGVEISKGPVRTSDWGVTALSEEQVRYAAADVEHLLLLAEALKQQLVEVGRDRLFAEVCAYLPVAADLEVSGIPNPLTY